MITWNPDDKTSNITLSNNNLTVDVSRALATDIHSVRATHGKIKGKWYWEVTHDISANNQLMFGVSTIDQALNSTLNSIYTAFSLSGLSQSVGTVYGFLLDMEQKNLIINKDNVQLASVPFREGMINKEVFPIIGLTTRDGLNKATASFGATPFKYSLPEGYLPYDVENADWFNLKKYLIQSNTDILTINSNNDLEVIKNIPPAKLDFETHGFEDLQHLIGIRTEKGRSMSYQNDLEGGKVYSLSVDRADIPVVEKIEIL